MYIISTTLEKIYINKQSMRKNILGERPKNPLYRFHILLSLYKFNNLKYI